MQRTRRDRGKLMNPTHATTLCIEDIVRHYSKRVQNGRTVQDAFDHMVKEVHELDVEVQRFIAGQPEGEDGIIGEAMDVISCALDVVFLAKPGTVNEEMREVLLNKMQKWLTLYGNPTK